MAATQTRIHKTEQFDLMFRMLYILSKEPMSRPDFAKRLGVGEQIIGRQIRFMRDVFKVEIDSSAAWGYELVGWGVFDKQMIKKYIFSEYEAADRA